MTVFNNSDVFSLDTDSLWCHYRTSCLFYVYFGANIGYDISIKGCESVNQNQQIEKLISENNGMICTSQIVKSGISKPVFYKYVKANDMEQVSHGVYAVKDAWIDSMYLLYLRCEQAIFSHETALFLHDLIDREPIEYEITVKTGYNPTKLKESGFKVYTVKEALHRDGFVMIQTPFGHFVPVYNIERTICDIIRNRNNTEIQTLQTALKRYIKRKDKDLHLLMQYAVKFRVDKILRHYLEVIL